MTDELKKKVEGIIDYCSTQADIYNNYQLGTKVVINGIYGAFGFSAFYFYNPQLAESVTQQGRDAILNAERLMNLWANKVWQKDTKTHEKMGIKITKPNENIKPISRYIDTDSVYCSHYQIVSVTDWMEHKVWRLTEINKSNDQKNFTYVSSGGFPTLEDAQKYFDIDSIDTKKYSFEIDQIEPAGREFCLTLNRVFMSDFLKKIHEDYAKKNGTPNILDFELEAYNEAGIWLAKKKYLKNMTWAEPNVYYSSCEKIKATGVEIAQTSSSPWVKKQLTDLVKWIFQQDEFTLDGFVKQLTKVKQQFMLQNVDTISLNKGMNKYNDYVLSDTGDIQLQPKAMVTVQGAALYNYIINSSEKFKKKYSILFDADKLCVIYIKPTTRYTYWQVKTQVPTKEVAKHPDMYMLLSDDIKRGVDNTGAPYEVYTNIMEKGCCEAFAYPAGNYPVDMTEFIDVNYDRMFELLILNPINRIIQAMGYAEIDISMTFESGLW
jgi:DNA polymerase elongation subunit (family B)